MHLHLFLSSVVVPYGRYVSWIAREAPVEQINEKTGCDRHVHPIEMVIPIGYTSEKIDISVREGQSGASYLT